MVPFYAYYSESAFTLSRQILALNKCYIIRYNTYDLNN